MDASAAALNTTPASPPPAANDAAAPSAGASDFLALLTAAPEAKTGKTKAGLGKVVATPIAKVATEAAGQADGAAATGQPAGKKDLAALAQRGPGGPARVNLASAAAGAGTAATDSTSAAAAAPGALPAALMAALSAAAEGGASALETPAVQTAQAVDDPARRDKAKPARTANAKADSGERTAKSDAGAPTAPQAKAETSPAEKTAKPHDAATPAAPKSGETPEAAPAIAQPPTNDPSSSGLAAGTAADTRDVRIPLAREVAAQTAVAAPVLALRVHTKDGATRAIEIRLDPAELGQVDVKLETGSDGKLKAVLSAENAESFELLKREGGALESALREAGVELGEDAVTFTLNEQGAGSGGGEREAAYGAAAARRDGDAALDIAALPAAAGWRNGVIDISV